MPLKKRLEIISLGDELLLGMRDNAQLTYLGRELARKGLSIARDQEIRDNAEEIQRHFLETWARADIVITTGGLGPTADDVTREAIAGALDLRLVENSEAAANVRRRLDHLGRSPNANHLRQSFIPEGAEVLPNHNGTAPGIWLEKDGKILVMMPGPGSEMRPMFIEQVLPRLEARDIALINEAYLQLRTCGLTESEVEALLGPVFEPYGKRIYLGYSSQAGMVDVRIGAADEALSWKDIEMLGDTCREVLGADFVGYGDANIAEIIARQLRARGKTVGVAESITGGLICGMFTGIPGVSKVFRGGVVCYNNDIKESMLDVPEPLLQQHGAVSAEVAVAMATGAQERLDADYGLSITGYAGPSGGNARNPVGTIFMGYASAQGVWSRRVNLSGDRQGVRERAATLALDWMRRKLKKFETSDVLERVVQE